ncbi:P-loop containing nucleoside triphosphate hydrolase protein, partial [Aspergillus stella-maris]|uniref:P-loop containing nucleoside triphosphate hydrolase protein n=1 Tax=Aspergillus stella-maris TaxID=1810926 RepID=UPI003CCD747D
MIYGYNSKLTSHGIDTILDYGRELMEEIKQVRNTKELQQRPIFFIAHSFGGIILAHCLVRAIQTMDNDHPAITSLHPATYGIILFAIPHKGLVIDDIQQMLATSGNHSRQHLLEQISHRSDILAHQLADFKNLIRDRKVTSFYETGQTRQLVFDSESQRWRRTGEFITTVDADSALLQLPDHVEDKVPLHADHSIIVKYNTRNEAGYRAVLDKLQQFAKDAPQVVAARFAQPARAQSGMTFTSHGGPQHNYVHRGHGAYHVNSGSGKQYNAKHQSFVMEVEADFSFREPAGLCLSQAPYIPSELFVGRSKELNQISEMLQPLDIQEQQRLVLGGVGGIGKTQLAIAYAKSCHQTYNSVFWLNAESEATLQDSFLLIAKQIFRLQQPDKLQAEDAVIHTCQWLSNTQNRRWLLIFDNYDDPNIFKIEQYCPFASHGVVLITTRQPNLVAGKKILIRPIQDIKDSLIILQSRSKRESTRTDPHAKRLAERLAGLPLALATAGAFLQHSTITFQRYLQEYEKRWNINPRQSTQLEEYQNRTLFTTWDLSYSRIQKIDPDAAELLKLLAYFSNQSLWHGLFSAGLTSTSPQWLHNVADDDISFDSVMKTLMDHCFLEVQILTSSWSMHGCVHDWTLAMLNKNINPEQFRYALDCVAASIPSNSTESLAHPSFSRLTAHGTRLVHQRFLESITLIQTFHDRYEDMLDIASLLHEQVQLVAAEEMYQRALAGKEKALGPDHISTLDTVNNLGILYSNQGKLQEAEE